MGKTPCKFSNLVTIALDDIIHAPVSECFHSTHYMALRTHLLECLRFSPVNFCPRMNWELIEAEMLHDGDFQPEAMSLIPNPVSLSTSSLRLLVRPLHRSLCAFFQILLWQTQYIIGQCGVPLEVPWLVGVEESRVEQLHHSCMISGLQLCHSILPSLLSRLIVNRPFAFLLPSDL